MGKKSNKLFNSNDKKLVNINKIPLKINRNQKISDEEFFKIKKPNKKRIGLKKLNNVEKIVKQKYKPIPQPKRKLKKYLIPKSHRELVQRHLKSNDYTIRNHKPNHSLINRKSQDFMFDSLNENDNKNNLKIQDKFYSPMNRIIQQESLNKESVNHEKLIENEGFKRNINMNNQFNEQKENNNFINQEQEKSYKPVVNGSFSLSSNEINNHNQNPQFFSFKSISDEEKSLKNNKMQLRMDLK